MHQIASFKTTFSKKLQLLRGAHIPSDTHLHRASVTAGTYVPFFDLHNLATHFEICSAAYACKWLLQDIFILLFTYGFFLSNTFFSEKKRRKKNNLWCFQEQLIIQLINSPKLITSSNALRIWQSPINPALPKNTLNNKSFDKHYFYSVRKIKTYILCNKTMQANYMIGNNPDNCARVQ